ncbi:MAG: hypothetical protein UY63_C0007G0014 [Parcubacteria group bacterium GW2011_GWA2_51_10]|nr:MAG: hypothetical protein UY63_C0007G0014 [Parcubacteria group bacterium GW2011_GWA2_51_10]
MQLLVRKKIELEERLLLPQLDAFFRWASEKHETATVLIAIDGKECRTIQKTRDHLKVQAAPVIRNPLFIVCRNAAFKELAEGFILEAQTCVPIFRSSMLEIWERRNSNIPEHNQPTRFGLSDAEKLSLLAQARQELRALLQNEVAPKHPHGARAEDATIALAIWVRGTLRASIVTRGPTLSTAIRSAAKEALHDQRFAPLSSDDVDEARIEITVLHDLRIPLSQRERAQRTFDATKGYYISDNAGHYAYYLPEVLNFERFADFQQFLARLAAKANIPEEQLPSTRVETFEVCDFIDSANGQGVCTLRGTMPAATFAHEVSDDALRSDLTRVLGAAAEHIASNQIANGSFPCVIEPLSGKIGTGIDLPRTALAAEALLHAGNTLKNDVFQKAADKALAYVSRTHIEKDTPSFSRVLTLLYRGRAAQARGQFDEAHGIARTASMGIQSAPYDPILFLLASSLFASFGKQDAELSRIAHRLTETALADFSRTLETDRADVNIALFPELIPALHILSTLHSDRSLAVRMSSVTEWYARHQQQDGSFPKSIGSPYSYVRGTAKIFEALAIDGAKNRPALTAAFAWLKSMQYTEDSTFFTPEAQRNVALGGFRYDMSTPDIWLDATSHVVIGVCRMLDHLNGKNPTTLGIRARE